MAKLPKYFYFRLHHANKGTAVEIEDASDVDVAEIVRCGQCKWSDKYYHCDRVMWWNSADDFCSRGERKDGN